MSTKIKNLSIGYDHPLATISLKLERGDKLGIIGENEDISDELLDYFRNLIELNKPFLSSFSKTKKSDENNSEDSEEN